MTRHHECEQLVILGAGFDTRCYRLSPRPAHCFEIDAPTTQAEKKEGLAAAGIDSSHVTFVAVDFNSDDWWAKLLAAGFDPRKPTVFTWEGVIYYLPDVAIDATFERIR